MKGQLATLLEPCDPAQFLRSIYARSPLVIEGVDRSRFQDVLSLNDFYDVAAGLKAPTTDLLHRPSLAHLIDMAARDGSINMDGVLSGYVQGSTVYMDHAERYHLPLRRLVRELSRQLAEWECPVASAGPATVFLTPRNSQALAPHTDPVDLLVLQVEGEKHWRFYGKSPQPGPPGAKLEHLPECTRELTLHAGDVLYLPRGYIHCAHTHDTHSLAISIGFAPYSWHDMISNALSLYLQGSPDLADPLPRGSIRDYKLTNAALDEFGAIVAKLVRDPLLAEHAQSLSLSSVRRRARSFEEANTIVAITPDTLLRARGELTFGEAEGRAILSSPAGHITGPAPLLRPLFHRLSGADGSFSVASIAPDGDTSLNVALARRLVFEGVCEIVAASRCATVRDVEAVL